MGPTPIEERARRPHGGPAAPATTRRTVAAVALLLACFALAAANSLIRDAATFDETAHLPAGLSYLERGDFRMNTEHPPLAKLWAALPPWMLGLVRPDYNAPAWRGLPGPDGLRTGADQWQFGYATLYGPTTARQRRDPRAALLAARLAMIVPGLVLGIVVFVWSDRLWGRHGAFLSLFLFCLSPTMLAHTRLVTTDLPAALGFAATLFAFRAACRSPTWPRRIGVAVALGATLLVKFSGLVLLAMLVVLGGCWTLFARDSDPRTRGTNAAMALGVAVVVGFAMIWAGYGFRFAASADAAYGLDWRGIFVRSDLTTRLIRTAAEVRVLPEGYLYGLGYVLGGATRRLAYLNGETSIVGWWTYFPQTFLMKTPTAMLLLLVGLVVRGWRRRATPSFEVVWLLLPIALYFALSMQSSLNIGHRHLLPVYPLLFVTAGSLAPGASKTVRRVLGGILLGYFLSFAAATPGYLSYFNGWAGGARNGWHYLLDSNLDWGQDLDRLGVWMRSREIDEIYLAYFGTADPRAYGVTYRKVLMVSDYHPRRRAERPPTGSRVAVSMNLLGGVYPERDVEVADAVLSRGLTTRAQIARWGALRDRRSLAGMDYPRFEDWMIAEGLVSTASWSELEPRLVTSWLRRLREQGQVEAYIGDSIRVYRAP